MPLGLRKQMRKQAEEAAAAAAKTASAAHREVPAAAQAAPGPDLGTSNQQQQRQQQLPGGSLLLPAFDTLQQQELIGPELLSTDELASLEQLLGVQHQEKGEASCCYPAALLAQPRQL